MGKDDNYFDNKDIAEDKSLEWNSTFIKEQGRRKRLTLAPHKDPKSPRMQGKMRPWKDVMAILLARINGPRKR